MTIMAGLDSSFSSFCLLTEDNESDPFKILSVQKSVTIFSKKCNYRKERVGVAGGGACIWILKRHYCSTNRPDMFLRWLAA